MAQAISSSDASTAAAAAHRRSSSAGVWEPGKTRATALGAIEARRPPARASWTNHLLFPLRGREGARRAGTFGRRGGGEVALRVCPAAGRGAWHSPGRRHAAKAPAARKARPLQSPPSPGPSRPPFTYSGSSTSAREGLLSLAYATRRPGARPLPTAPPAAAPLPLLPFACRGGLGGRGIGGGLSCGIAGVATLPGRWPEDFMRRMCMLHWRPAAVQEPRHGTAHPLAHLRRRCCVARHAACALLLPLPLRVPATEECCDEISTPLAALRSPRGAATPCFEAPASGPRLAPTLRTAIESSWTP
jgi:hypothetical protein